jgi:hypothetical protein
MERDGALYSGEIASSNAGRRELGCSEQRGIKQNHQVETVRLGIQVWTHLNHVAFLL